MGVAASQPIQWSCEFTDTDLGLVYYNYRHYNPLDGRWTGRDIMELKQITNVYDFTMNLPDNMYEFIHNPVVVFISSIAFAVFFPFVAYYFFLNKLLIKLLTSNFLLSGGFSVVFARRFVNVFNWILVAGNVLGVIVLLCQINILLRGTAGERMDYIENWVYVLSGFVALYLGMRRNKQRLNV